VRVHALACECVVFPFVLGIILGDA
jgi:hypothetical protein